MITTSATASKAKLARFSVVVEATAVEHRPDRSAACRRAVGVEAVRRPPSGGVDQDERQVDHCQRPAPDRPNLGRPARPSQGELVADQRDDEQGRVELECAADRERQRRQPWAARPPEVDAGDARGDREQIPVVKRVDRQDRRGRPEDRAPGDHPPEQPGRNGCAQGEHDHRDGQVRGSAPREPPNGPHEQPRQNGILVEPVCALPTSERRVHVREDVVTDPVAVVERLDVVVTEPRPPEAVVSAETLALQRRPRAQRDGERSAQQREHKSSRAARRERDGD